MLGYVSTRRTNTLSFSTLADLGTAPRRIAGRGSMRGTSSTSCESLCHSPCCWRLEDVSCQLRDGVDGSGGGGGDAPEGLGLEECHFEYSGGINRKYV